jgi:hypothetical protein
MQKDKKKNRSVRGRMPTVSGSEMAGQKNRKKIKDPAA